MNRIEKLIFFSFCVLCFFCLNCDAIQEKGIRITVITQAMDSEFWQKVKQGAEDAAKEHPDVTLSVLAPAREINIDQQVNIVEDQILKRVSAIAVSPCGAAEIIPMLDKAYAKKIPVIIFNSDIDWEHKLSFVGTDNYLGGRLAGEFITTALNGKGKVAVIRGIVGIRGHEERVGGFLNVMKAAKEIEIVSIQPANSERELALTVMENILTIHPDLDAVFMTNDGMALGALEAIDAHRLTNKIITVGFDGSREAIQAVKDERLTAEVVQNPYNIGRQALVTAYKAAKGESIEKRIDTGTLIINKSIVDEYYDEHHEIIQRN
jgi:ribose transport system substrate-binding protein